MFDLAWLHFGILIFGKGLFTQKVLSFIYVAAATVALFDIGVPGLIFIDIYPH
jgi:hypothetical protein